MTSPLQQYDERILASWRSGRLGCLFVNSFMMSRTHPDELTQLERITRVMAARSFEERKSLFEFVQRERFRFVSAEYYESAAVFRDMETHYRNRILD